MPKLPNEAQLYWEKQNDPAEISSLILDGLDAQDIKRLMPDWGINRIKRAIRNFREGEVLRNLGTTKLPGKEPPAPCKLIKNDGPLSLNIQPGTHYGVIVADISLGSQHKSFIRNILNYAERDGYLPIFCARPFEKTKINLFPEEVREFLRFENFTITNDVLVVTEHGKARSNVDPLNGMLTENAGKHVVVCHPTVAMQSIARMACNDPAEAWTSGSVTVAGQSKRDCQALAIQIAEDGTPFFHQLKADHDGSFQFLDTFVTADEIVEGVRVKAVHMPDVHADVMAHPVAEALFGWDMTTKQFAFENNVIDWLCPENIFIDDVLNFSYRGPFSKTSTELARQYHLGQGSVRQEIIETARLLNSMTRPWTTVYKIEDNHGRRFVDWIEGDNRKDPIPDNTQFWAEMMVAKFQMIADDPEDFRNAYLEHEAFLKCGLSGDVKFIWRGQSVKIAGTEHGIHFHQGVNGSPGRAAQFKALGYPVVGGHPHTPRIDGTVISVGTCSDLRERWDPDCSGKAHAFAVQYHNGHTVLVTMRPDGRVVAATNVAADRQEAA